MDEDHIQQEDVHSTMTGDKLIGEPDACTPPKGINDLESQRTTYKDYVEYIAKGTRGFL